MRYYNQTYNPYLPECAALPEPQLCITPGWDVAPSAIMHLELLDDYNVFIIFYDLKCGIFDLSRLFTHKWVLQKRFEVLRDKEVFHKIHYDNNGQLIVWDDDYDLASAALYYDPDNLYVDVELKSYHYDAKTA